MAILPIVTGKETPILRQKTVPVTKITKEIQKLVSDMEQTTKAAKGAGIAAPQVNRTERICIALIQRELVTLINPVILWRSTETEIMEEGCLSLPDIWLLIPRSTEVILTYKSIKGRKRELKLIGFDARVIQHELDHLDGILITDYQK